MSLIKLETLYSKDSVEIYKKHGEYNVLVNSKPKPDWIYTREIGEQKIQYLPAERVEFLLDAIFKSWRVEVKNIQTIANSVVVTIRLYYLHPVTGSYEFQDGIGAAPIIVNKGAAPTDFSAVQSMSVTKAAPAAETEAIKDAAHKIGRIFGRNLNRRDVVEYEAIEQRIEANLKREKLKEINDLLKDNQDSEEVESIRAMINAKIDSKEDTLNFYDNIIKELKNDK